MIPGSLLSFYPVEALRPKLELTSVRRKGLVQECRCTPTSSYFEPVCFPPSDEVVNFGEFKPSARTSNQVHGRSGSHSTYSDTYSTLSNTTASLVSRRYIRHLLLAVASFTDGSVSPKPTSKYGNRSLMDVPSGRANCGGGLSANCHLAARLTAMVALFHLGRPGRENDILPYNSLGRLTSVLVGPMGSFPLFAATTKPLLSPEYDMHMTSTPHRRPPIYGP